MDHIANTDVINAHAKFIDLVLPVMEELVPLKKTGKLFGRRKVDKVRRSLWRRLGNVKKKLGSTTSVSRVAKLLLCKQKIEVKLKDSYSKQHWDEESRVVNNMKKNPKTFFAYGRARQKTKAKVGPFLDTDGVPNSDPDYAANVLSDQYSSVFTQPRPEYSVADVSEFFGGGDDEWRRKHQGMPLLQDIQFTEEDVMIACKELKSNSSPGPDGVPAALLKTANEELSHPLYVLWRASLDQGVI